VKHLEKDCVCVCVCVCFYILAEQQMNYKPQKRKYLSSFFGLFAAWAARSSDAIAVTSSRDCCSLLPGYYPMVITYGYYSEWTYTHDHSDPCCSFVFNCNCVLFYKIKALEISCILALLSHSKMYLFKQAFPVISP